MQRAALVVVVVAFLLGSDVPGRSDAAEASLRRAPAVGPERPLTDPVPTGAQGAQRGGAVAFDGTRYLVTWFDERSDAGIYASRVTTAGTVLDPSGIRIATGAIYALGGTTVAFDGTNYLVAWTASAAGGIRGVRVSKAGAVLDAEPISISAGGAGFAPTLAFDGTNYLVVWSDGSRLVGARVSKSGTVLDPNGILMPTGASRQRPAVSSTAPTT